MSPSSGHRRDSGATLEPQDNTLALTHGCRLPKPPRRERPGHCPLPWGWCCFQRPLPSRSSEAPAAGPEPQDLGEEVAGARLHQNLIQPSGVMRAALGDTQRGSTDTCDTRSSHTSPGKAGRAGGAGGTRNRERLEPPIPRSQSRPAHGTDGLGGGRSLPGPAGCSAGGAGPRPHRAPNPAPRTPHRTPQPPNPRTAKPPHREPESLRPRTPSPPPGGERDPARRLRIPRGAPGAPEDIRTVTATATASPAAAPLFPSCGDEAPDGAAPAPALPPLQAPALSREIGTSRGHRCSPPLPG